MEGSKRWVEGGHPRGWGMCEPGTGNTSQELQIKSPLFIVAVWQENLKIFIMEGGGLLLVWAQFGGRSQNLYFFLHLLFLGSPKAENT